MGGKSGGGARTPVIWANTAHSAQRLKILDLIGSGEIFGFEKGNDEPLKSIYLNGTPIQNDDGTLNFSGVRTEYNRGTEDQDYLPSFGSVDRSVEVLTRVKKDNPITRTITNKLITSLRVTVGVDALVWSTMEGDQYPTTAAMNVQLLKDNVIYTSKLFSIYEKGNKPFRHDVVFEDLPEAPFEVRCVRDMVDSNDDMLKNDTYFFSYVESIDAKMRYPLSAIVGLEIDSDQFGEGIPTRTYGIKGAIVQVPSNYDPVARTYEGLWDRLFKPAFTNNPAWILYDLLTNEVDGFGGRLQGFRIDIDKFYEASKYCDELVDDGAGGKEPRFICNATMTGDDAYTAINNVASSFRGVCAYNGELITLYYDRAHDVTAIYTNANVVEGLFDYSQVESSKQYNQVQVQYVDEENGYEATIDEVSDDANTALLERIVLLSIVAFGATKLSYARRTALWALITSLTETELVTFKVGAVGIKHEIYDIIQIADNDYVGTTLGARVNAVNGTKITLDRVLNDALKFSIDTKEGLQNFNVKRQISEKEYELDKVPLIVDNAPCTAILAEVEPRLFRCLSIAENDDGTYTISAIEHNPQKEAIVDKGAQYIPEKTTVINPVPSLSNGIANNDGKAIILEWDSLAVIGANNSYRIQLFRDKALYKTFETKETSLRLESLPQGEYVAKIRAVNEKGQHSEELTIVFSTTYKIDGLRAKPVVFGIDLSWQLPALITSDAVTEVWYSIQDDRQTATKLAVVTYPQNHYQLSGLSAHDQFYFWFRLVDAAGNQGEFSYSILGKPNDSADDILEYLDGKISEKEISTDLQSQFDKNIDDKLNIAKEEINEQIGGINTDIEGIGNDLLGVKKEAEKALADAEKNAKDIIDQSKTIASVSEKQGQSEANWQLAQMSNVSAQKSNFARAMTMSGQVANNTARIEEVDSLVVTEKAATATRFTQVNTRVDNAESKITRVETSLSDDIQAEASKREALEVEFDLNKATQQLSSMTFATSDKSMSSRLFSLSASTANAHVKYDELQEVVVTNEEARVTSEQKMQAEIGSSKSEIQRIDRVMTSEFASQATSISELSSELDSAQADIKKAEQTIVDSEKSQAKKNESFGSQFDASNAKQQLAIITESTGNRSLSQRYTLLSAQTANSAARLEVLQKSFVDSETAWTLSEERLQSQIDNSKSEIQRVERTANDRDKALTEQINSAKSEIDEHTASITQISSAQASIDGKVNAMWTLKVDANGAIGGIMLGSDGKESLFKVAADTFVVSTGDQSVNMFTMQQVNGKYIAALNGDLIAKGTISSDMLVANIEIKAPVIKGGSIKAGYFEGGRIDIGNGNFTVNNKGELLAKAGRFEGTVYADKIEGDIVSFITIKRTTVSRGGRYNFTIEAEGFDREIRFEPFTAASWLTLQDGRSHKATPMLKVFLNEKNIYTIDDHYFPVYSDKDSGSWTSGTYRTTWIKSFFRSEAQANANGMGGKLAISSGIFSVKIPKNIVANFAIEFYPFGAIRDDSFAVSEIPAVIYRESRTQVIYPTT